MTVRREELEKFLDYNAPMDVPVRQAYCPFCEPDKVTSHGFVVTRKRNGFSMWCHRCHTKYWYPIKSPSSSAILSELHRRAVGNKDNASVVTKKVTLPSDFTADIPASGLLWLRTYGVNEDEIRRYHFGYSPRLDRLILPVFRDGELVFWQGRNLSSDTSRPKYMNVRSQRSDIVLFVNNQTSKVVLVEDILSCLAVARAGVSAVALLGSYVKMDLLRDVLADADIACIKVWLDPDKRQEACKYAKQLRALGYSASPIVLAHQDPKCYKPEEVQRFIGGATCSDSERKPTMGLRGKTCPSVWPSVRKP